MDDPSRKWWNVLTDPVRMIRDIRTTLTVPLRIWGAALNFPQMIGGIIFITRPEGAVILGGWILMILTAGYIHRHMPFSRLIGICQVWWLPILPYLITRLWAQDGVNLFSVWLGYVVVTMTISLFLDTIDLRNYIATNNKTYRKREG